MTDTPGAKTSRLIILANVMLTSGILYSLPAMYAVGWPVVAELFAALGTVIGVRLIILVDQWRQREQSLDGGADA